jgi:hypothetical protein
MFGTLPPRLESKLDRLLDVPTPVSPGIDGRLADRPENDEV